MNVSVEARPHGIGESNAPAVVTRFKPREKFDGTMAAVWVDGSEFAMSVTVGSPALARELAQQLQGAADALVEHAQRAEARA